MEVGIGIGFYVWENSLVCTVHVYVWCYDVSYVRVHVVSFAWMLCMLQAFDGGYTIRISATLPVEKPLHCSSRFLESTHVCNVWTLKHRQKET